MQRYRTVIRTISIGATTLEPKEVGSSLEGRLAIWRGEVGAPVFIVVRCIAAARAAGSAYESINHLIKVAPVQVLLVEVTQGRSDLGCQNRSRMSKLEQGCPPFFARRIRAAQLAVDQEVGKRSTGTRTSTNPRSLFLVYEHVPKSGIKRKRELSRNNDFKQAFCSRL